MVTTSLLEKSLFQLYSLPFVLSTSLRVLCGLQFLGNLSKLQYI